MWSNDRTDHIMEPFEYKNQMKIKQLRQMFLAFAEILIFSTSREDSTMVVSAQSTVAMAKNNCLAGRRPEPSPRRVWWIEVSVFVNNQMSFPEAFSVHSMDVPGFESKLVRFQNDIKVRPSVKLELPMESSQNLRKPAVVRRDGFP